MGSSHLPSGTLDILLPCLLSYLLFPFPFFLFLDSRVCSRHTRACLVLWSPEIGCPVGVGEEHEDHCREGGGEEATEEGKEGKEKTDEDHSIARKACITDSCALRTIRITTNKVASTS